MDTLRVVIVDDEQDFRVLSETKLREIPGVEIVGQGSSGEEAISLCEQLKPDLLLIDLMMGGINGIEASRQIKQQAEPPAIAIVSLYADRENRGAAWEAGAETYIDKADFLSEVDRVIAHMKYGDPEELNEPEDAYPPDYYG